MESLTFENLFSKEDIESALTELEAKRDSCGTDGIYLSGLREYWDVNGNDILELLREEKYTPVMVRTAEVVNAKGKKRTIYLFSSVDRLILKCLSMQIDSAYDGIFRDGCYAFRKNKGITDAAEKASDYLDEGKTWTARIDIQHYYDAIPLDGMEQDLKQVISDARICRLLMKYLRIRVEDGERKNAKTRGILTGNPLSTFMSNLYLSEFDATIEDQGYSCCRFCDDIAIFCTTQEEAQKVYDYATALLKDKYKLPLNTSKSGVFEGLHQQFLGFQFSRDKKTGKVLAQRNPRPEKEHYSNWNQENVKKVDGSYHLINNGILSRRDYNILFENESGKKYIPVETTNAINVYSNVVFSTGFFWYMAKKRINVNIFDRYGECVGTFVTSDNGYQGKTMLRQAAVYLDPVKRMAGAKALEIGAMHNIRSNLKYYQKRIQSKNLDKAVITFGQIIAELNRSKDTESLMLIEARARQLYYSMFNEIMHEEDFMFTKRTRRPPRDALNAMISFGNTYLYNRIATEIRKSTLDIRIGFIHATTSRSQSLNLDIADLFKPLIVDRAIFTLVNKHMINANDHFEHVKVDDEDGIYLNKEGKRIFIQQLDQKIYQKQTVKGESLSYDTRIKQEISKIFRMVIYGETYHPFKYQQ